MNERVVLSYLIHIMSIFALLVQKGQALGCYKCTSTNGSNSNCEDPFNSIDQVYDKDCKAPRPMRSGLFPATQCLKISYCSYNPKICYMIRNCVADNGGMNADSEIGRTDHCGFGMSEIIIENKKVYGCITACSKDGCNASHTLTPDVSLLILVLTICLLRMER